MATEISGPAVGFNFYSEKDALSALRLAICEEQPEDSERPEDLQRVQTVAATIRDILAEDPIATVAFIGITQQIGPEDVRLGDTDPTLGFLRVTTGLSTSAVESFWTHNKNTVRDPEA